MAALQAEVAGSLRTVLITGCSSGIGEATARRLLQSGFHVYATAREPGALEHLRSLGAVTQRLDVADEASRRAAVERVVADRGALDVLINNAGYGLAGPVEEADLDEVRAQFEANFFGLAGLTQLVLPGMRERGAGAIVNVSSVFGRFAAPGGAYYQASKHAVEAFTEALRLEVAPHGIRAMLIEPGPVRTAFSDAALARLNAHAEGTAYKAFREALAQWYAATYDRPPRNVAGRLAVTPERVAEVIERAVRSHGTRGRYPVGLLPRMLLSLRRWAPAPVFDAFVRSQFPTP